MINWPPTYPTDKEWRTIGLSNRTRRNYQLWQQGAGGWTHSNITDVRPVNFRNDQWQRLTDLSTSFGAVWQADTGRPTNIRRFLVAEIRKDDIPRTTRFPLLRLQLAGGTAANHDFRLDTSDGTFSAVITSGGGTVAGGVADRGDYWEIYLDSTDAGTNTDANVWLYPAVGADAAWAYTATATGEIDLKFVGLVETTDVNEALQWARRRTGDTAYEVGTGWYDDEWSTAITRGAVATGNPQYDCLQCYHSYYEGDMTLLPKRGLYTHTDWNKVIKEQYTITNDCEEADNFSAWTSTGTISSNTAAANYTMPRPVQKAGGRVLEITQAVGQSGTLDNLTADLAIADFYQQFYVLKQPDTTLGAMGCEYRLNNVAGRIVIDQSDGTFATTAVEGAGFSAATVVDNGDGWWKVNLEMTSAFTDNINEGLTFWPRYRDDATQAVTAQTGTPGVAVICGCHEHNEFAGADDKDRHYVPVYSGAQVIKRFTGYNQFNDSRYVLGSANYG